MLKTYLLTAYRTLIRNKSYSFLNVLGLSLGITCSILLFLVIKYELSFDKFHEIADRIYRIVLYYKIVGPPQSQVALQVPVPRVLRERYPDDVALVGFTTYTGTVTAAHDWDEPAQKMKVRPALPDSVEDLLHQAGLPALTDPPSGCRFHPRCVEVFEPCSMVRPAPIGIAPGHPGACHRYGAARRE